MALKWSIEKLYDTSVIGKKKLWHSSELRTHIIVFKWWKKKLWYSSERHTKVMALEMTFFPKTRNQDSLTMTREKLTSEQKGKSKPNHSELHKY